MAWETDSGFLDEFEGVIVEAKFQESEAEFREGEPELHLTFADIKAEDVPTSEVPDTIPRFYSVGKQFEVVDENTVARIDGTNRGINNATAYGKFIDRITGKDPEYRSAMEGALDVLKERGTELEASVWVGLRLEMAPTTFSFKDRETKEEIEYTRVLPVAFLGAEDTSGHSTAESNSEGDAPSRKALEAKLTALAKKHESHEDFLLAALDVDGVTDDEELFEAVGDDSEDGFYAQATV